MWKVSSEDSGVRVQAFLKKNLGDSYSARQIKAMIEANSCKINGKVERFASAKVFSGDRVTFNKERKLVNIRDVESLRIIYEDDDLFIYNKPPGISSEDLESLCKNYNSKISLAHRLDKDTSGIIVFAKNSKALEALFLQFRKREIKKEYLAVVDGVPVEEQGVIRNWMGIHRRMEGKVLWKVAKRGKEAMTSWRVEGKKRGMALVRCWPKTGRTHQIRVHMSHIGHPILGDHDYAKQFRSKWDFPRHLLHAAALSLFHPKSGELKCFRVAIPDDFPPLITAL